MKNSIGMRRFEIKWKSKGMNRYGYICSHFGWNDLHLTLNGHCWVSVSEEHIDAFMKTAQRHYFSIICEL